MVFVIVLTMSLDTVHKRHATMPVQIIAKICAFPDKDNPSVVLVYCYGNTSSFLNLDYHTVIDYSVLWDNTTDTLSHTRLVPFLEKRPV